MEFEAGVSQEFQSIVSGVAMVSEEDLELLGMVLNAREGLGSIGREWLDHAKRSWDQGSLHNAKEVAKWARTVLDNVTGERNRAACKVKSAAGDEQNQASTSGGSEGKSGVASTDGTSGTVSQTPRVSLADLHAFREKMAKMKEKNSQDAWLTGLIVLESFV